MRFFSHRKVDQDSKPYGSKHLLTHIKGVTDKALLHYSANCDLGPTDAELRSLIKIIAVFHDLGKYTTYFQNYLLDQSPVDPILKQHAKIGGISAYNNLKHLSEKQALLALYAIFHHHSNLTDLQRITKRINDDLKIIVKQQQENITQNITQIEGELAIKDLINLMTYPDERAVRRGIKNWVLNQSGIKDYFLINYLFSLLVEADKLDASDTKPYLPVKIDQNSVDNRFGRRDANIGVGELRKLSNNELRNFCRSQVLSHLANDNILETFIFTLTAPTGTGKTMTALDFALKLKSKISAQLSFEPRIIYALPFINIIEQSIAEYDQTLPSDTKIIGHYQYADLFGKDAEVNEDGAEINYDQKLMAIDTWQADVIITSFVQFFESLISNRNRLLKKFNHYANSIIILDEVQTLRLDQMPLIGATLFFLTKFLKARVILMTATKPEIFKLAEDQILRNERETVSPLELLPCYEAVFSSFERTMIIPLLDIPFSEESTADDFVEQIFSKKWSSDKSCIIVCNTVKRSIELFETIVAWLTRRNFSNRVEYLSTNIIPANRLSRIHRLRRLIESAEAPILVSTQVVEAGVDLDFDMGFRDIGPIDSIIQVSGRINRNNKAEKRNSPLFVVDFRDAQKIYGSITYSQAQRSLQAQPEFYESNYLELVRIYFENITNKKSFARFNKIFESMKLLRYDSNDIEQDRPVSCFKIIDESNTSQAVFIEIGEEEKLLRRKYLEKIKRIISKEEFEKEHKLGFQQRIVLVPNRLSRGLPPINEFDDRIKVVTNSSLTQYYDLETGFIRKADDPITFF